MTLAAAPAAAAGPEPIRPLATLVASIRGECLRVVAERAKPPPVTVRARLEQLVDFDQAGREDYAALASLSPEDRKRPEALSAIDCLKAKELANQAQLKAMLPSSGWFARRVYGRKAALGAWLVVDHAVNDPELMRTALARLKPGASAGVFEQGQYAILYDRVAFVLDHRPQRYGTQVECKAGHWRAASLEDPANLNRRRRGIGLKQSEAEYLRTFTGDPCS